MNTFFKITPQNFKLIILLFFLFIAQCGFAMEEAEENKYAFSAEDYKHFMKLIKQIDPAAYKTLKQCEAETSEPCIEKYLDKDPGSEEALGSVIPANAYTQGFPFLLLDPKIRDFDEESEKRYLKIYLDWYNQTPVIPPITTNEQKHTLEIIKSIAPELYEEIIAVDPDGSAHVVRHYEDSLAVYPSETDGLPIIMVGPSKMTLPIGEQRFGIGHELGHYVLEYFLDIKKLKPTHAGLTTKQHGSMEEFTKGKKVSGQLSFETAFKHAYNRTLEDEADRFAAIDLGLSIDDGIANAKRLAARAKEHEITSPEKETFHSTHPFWSARIKHLKELRREVEIRKARNAQPQNINWKELAEVYLKMYNDYK